MKLFLREHGYDAWYSIVTWYIDSKKPKTVAKKESKRNKKIVMDFIMERLPNSVKVKMGQCLSAKELSDKLQNLYLKESHIQHEYEEDVEL